MMEYEVWGIVGNDPEPQPLFTKCPRTGGPITDQPTADCFANIAISRGAEQVRVRSMDMSVCPSEDWKV